MSTTERTKLETERREIAQQRQQAPIVAEAIRGTGLFLVCALPLAVVIYLLYSLRSQPVARRCANRDFGTGTGGRGAEAR